MWSLVVFTNNKLLGSHPCLSSPCSFEGDGILALQAAGKVSPARQTGACFPVRWIWTLVLRRTRSLLVCDHVTEGRADLLGIQILITPHPAFRKAMNDRIHATGYPLPRFLDSITFVLMLPKPSAAAGRQPGQWPLGICLSSSNNKLKLNLQFGICMLDVDPAKNVKVNHRYRFDCQLTHWSALARNFFRREEAGRTWPELARVSLSFVARD